MQVKYKSTKKDILNAGKTFYENLYSDCVRAENYEIISNLFTSSLEISKISDEARLNCDLKLQPDEILNSLKGLNNKKSPGTDGLTTEFYKFFWNDIKEYLLNSFNYSLETGELSIEQRRGIITLIPKKDKDKRHLKNWRPISLLNTDYKILTKTLANRLCKILPDIINEDQTGFIKGRYIGCNIRLLEDMIHYTAVSNTPGIILNIDFEKAFDSINWRFIEKTLETFNFGSNFIFYIKTLYNNITSTVINNGNISGWFPLERGVRQGCPISPYIFILVAELLAISVRENNKIEGIMVDDVEIKISQLADDTTCYLRNTNSVTELVNTLNVFGKCSGLKINIEKTKAKFIGSLIDSEDYVSDLEWTKDSLASLGVVISGNNLDHYELNYNKRILNLKYLLNSWKCRKLSLKGKITVVNTLALPPLFYLASIIWVPERVIKEVKQIITDFIWDGKPAKIAYNVLIQNISKGGLKLIDLETKIKALKVTWIRRLIIGKMERWKAIPMNLFKTKDFFKLFRSNESPRKSIPPFYQDVHKYWSELQIVNSKDRETLLCQIIWNNRYINTRILPLSCEKWLKKGIIYIKDILTESGEIMNHTEINNRYGVGCNYLNMLQIKYKIPLQWREILKGVNLNNYNFVNLDNMLLFRNGNKITTPNLTCKSVYSFFMEEKEIIPKCTLKWAEEYPKFNEAPQVMDLWANIFNIPFNDVRSTKLQSFQYKLVHRIITCRKTLFNMKIIDNPTCIFCEEVDDLIHFILFCPKTREFWNFFFNWWNGISDIKINSKCVELEESILFGFQIMEDEFKVLNYCIIHAKFYIYRNKIFGSNSLHLYEFLCELKRALRIEHDINCNNETEKSFSKFLFIYENL